MWRSEFWSPHSPAMASLSSSLFLCPTWEAWAYLYHTLWWLIYIFRAMGVIDHNTSGKEAVCSSGLKMSPSLIMIQERRWCLGVCKSWKGFQFHFLSLQIKKLRPRNNLTSHFLSLGPLQAWPKAGWVQVVYLGGTCRDGEWGSRERGREEGKSNLWVDFEGWYCRQLGLDFAPRFLLWKDWKLEHLYNCPCSLLVRS